ncbi:MAG: ATP-binding protein [Xanthomonadales bacterium]|nr:ATP-binding protein [Xanthomonadales bacterium]
MNRLYWKIFLSFWLTLILIVGLMTWINVSLETRFGGSQVPERMELLLRGSVERTAEAIRRGGLRGPRRRGGQGPRQMRMVYVFDASGVEILGRPVPRELEPFVAVGEPPNRSEAARVYAVTTRDPQGNLYRVAALAPRPPGPLYAASGQGVALRLGIAVLVSALVCGFLARSISRPIKRLRWAAGELTSGRLDARVGRLPGIGAREFDALGTDFDQMAGRLEHSHEAQKRLLMDVSHELRSPLARVQVATELARKRSGGAATAELDRIEQETDRLNQLIGEILHLARADQQKSPLQLEQTDLSELLTEVVERNRLDAGCTLQLALPEGPVLCSIDAPLIDRAVENVLRNAIRYTGEAGTVTVELAVQADAVEISVRDQGPGIAEADLKQVFRPFYRVGEARDRETGGHGLGLAIAQSAIQRHGGDISAANHSSGGLKVTLQLPR